MVYRTSVRMDSRMPQKKKKTPTEKLCHFMTCISCRNDNKSIPKLKDKTIKRKLIPLIKEGADINVRGGRLFQGTIIDLLKDSGKDKWIPEITRIHNEVVKDNINAFMEKGKIETGYCLKDLGRDWLKQDLI